MERVGIVGGLWFGSACQFDVCGEGVGDDDATMKFSEESNNERTPTTTRKQKVTSDLRTTLF